MRKLVLIIICFILSMQIAWPQGGISLQVLAVKGTVKYQSKVLKKDDVITVSNLTALPAALDYSGSGDWVNFLNKKDKKVLNYYASQKKTADGRYMFSRGVDNAEFPEEWNRPGLKHLKGEKEVMLYFSRSMAMLFSYDTLVCTGMKVYETRDGSGFMLRYALDTVSFSSMLGRNDTLYITPSQFFPEAGQNGQPGPVNSYSVGPMRLYYYDHESGKNTKLELDEFNLYFFEDVVKGLRSLGMDDKDICEEIMYVFAGREQLEQASGWKEDKKIHAWLLKKIKKIR